MAPLASGGDHAETMASPCAGYWQVAASLRAKGPGLSFPCRENRWHLSRLRTFAGYRPPPCRSSASAPQLSSAAGHAEGICSRFRIRWGRQHVEAASESPSLRCEPLPLPLPSSCYQISCSLRMLLQGHTPRAPSSPSSSLIILIEVIFCRSARCRYITSLPFPS